jgi:hypothetical protein
MIPPIVGFIPGKFPTCADCSDKIKTAISSPMTVNLAKIVKTSNILVIRDEPPGSMSIRKFEAGGLMVD